jgi:hypothetical protein
VVARLRAAGAVLVGKTRTHEFAYGVLTPGTVNPWDETRIAGGSSGGSAAAVAAGLVPGAVGSDTAGSIRIPAACCGVVGFKPTWGAVPAGGVWPLACTTVPLWLATKQLRTDPSWFGTHSHRRCCVMATGGMLKSWPPPDQMAKASSLNATATRRSAGSSTASS